MDHPLPSPDAVRPWRTATLLVSAVAVVELVVIVAAGVIVLGRSVAKHVEKTALHRVYAPVRTTGTPIDARPGKAARPRSQTVVTVLNGGGVAGAAAARAEVLRSLGYTIGPVGNAPSQVARTVVEYRPGFRAEAARLAADLHVAAISPLDGLRPRDLLGAQIAVILGT